MRWHVHFWFSILILAVAFSVGAGVYHNVEGWSVLDSLYFTVITATTIGYGDLVPVTTAGKIFTMFFSFFGIAMVFYYVSIIGNFVFERKMESHADELHEKIKDVKEEKKKLIKIKKRKKK